MQRRLFMMATVAGVLLMLAASHAAATAQRTFVASYGSPANTAFNCSIVKPCRAFSEAISVTSAGGEVIVLDSAGYGPVTIAQSVSIIAPAGVYGGISVLSGVGITVDGSSIKVVLRGLTINGQGGTVGIEFLQGTKLTIEDCEISNMTFDGIRLYAPGSTITVKNTVIRDIVNFGIDVGAGRLTVTNSVLTNNAVIGITAGSNAGSVTDVMVTRSTITGALYGLYVQAGPGSTTRLVSDSNVINNVSAAAFRFEGGAGTESIYTSGNNTVGFNNAIVSGGTLTPIGTH